MLKQSRFPARLWLRVLIPFAVGYFLSYFFRSVNAVISPDLTKELGLSAGDLGLLTSAYFFSFALFQLPLGMLLDRYSPKRIEAMLLLIAAAGALVFALSDTSSGLATGRALIGLGVSACLMAGYTACALWFTPQQIPAVNAVILSAGGLGALTATAPLEWTLRFVDWRALFVMLAGFALATAALIFFVAPERERRVHHVSWSAQLQGSLSVFKSASFWRIAPAATIAQASFLAIQGLWAGPWLRNVVGLSRDSAATYLLWMAAAMVAGQLTWGILASRLAHRGIAPLVLLKWGLAVYLLVQGAIVAGASSLVLPLWMLFGFFGVAGSLAYPIIAQQFPSALTGRANTAVNLLVFVLAFAAQWAIGVIVDAWPATGGSEPAGYRAAFAAVLVLQALAFFWLILKKEPGADPTEDFNHH
ncbi:MAG: MFS transporter [Burkholderiales bacterium]|nr:MFS transporter [Burkholderiales bacterium]